MMFSDEQRESWARTTKDSPFNRWMRAQVNNRDGTLNLERLHELAREYGIDPSAYLSLNPGQQRMNIGNRLRNRVPAGVYEGDMANPEKDSRSRLLSAPPVDASRVGRSPSRLPTMNAAQKSPLIEGAKVVSLLRLHGEIIQELRDRGIVRTSNSPLGDYAEHLFAQAFDWKLVQNSAAGFDALDAKGVRYQIKARRVVGSGAGHRQLSVMRGLPDAKFDVLAAVLFDWRYSVYRAALIPHSVVLTTAKHIQHVNGWRFMLEDRVWDLANVTDVTDKLRAAAEAL